MFAVSPCLILAPMLLSCSLKKKKENTDTEDITAMLSAEKAKVKKKPGGLCNVGGF